MPVAGGHCRILCELRLDMRNWSWPVLTFGNGRYKLPSAWGKCCGVWSYKKKKILWRRWRRKKSLLRVSELGSGGVFQLLKWQFQWYFAPQEEEEATGQAWRSSWPANPRSVEKMYSFPGRITRKVYGRMLSAFSTNMQQKIRRFTKYLIVTSPFRQSLCTVVRNTGDCR